MEEAINWILANISAGRTPIQIRVNTRYATEIINRNIVSANIILPPNAGEQHLIILIDQQNISWKATLCV